MVMKDLTEDNKVNELTIVLKTLEIILLFQIQSMTIRFSKKNLKRKK